MARTSRSIVTRPALTLLGLLLAGALVAACGGGTDPSMDQAAAIALPGTTAEPTLAEPSASAEPSAPTKHSAPTRHGAPTKHGTPTKDGAPTEPSTPTEPETPAPSQPSVAVAFAAAVPGDAFIPLIEAFIDSSAAVYVITDWTGVTVDQAERLKLVSPDGSVYYATQISFADAATSLVGAWAMPDGTRRVAFKLLIWGTTIESYWQVGTWTATADLVDGGASGTATLELR